MADDFKWQQQVFNNTLREYIQYTSRTIPEAINTKAFFIARRAVVETHSADLSKISSLGRKTNKILGMIINKRRGQRGQKGLYGKEMLKEVAVVLAARKRSRAFLKSGWLPAIKTLEKAVPAKYRREAIKSDRTAKQIGRPKGNAIPAKVGLKVVAQIENAIGTEGKRSVKHNTALQKFGAPALSKAFAHETASMRDYIQQKMKPDADRFNAAQKH